jgi:hypothetical protein
MFGRLAIGQRDRDYALARGQLLALAEMLSGGLNVRFQGRSGHKWR